MSHWNIKYESKKVGVFGKEATDIINKRLAELKEDKTKAMFESWNCANQQHASFVNELTIHKDINKFGFKCCCDDFDREVRRELGISETF